MPLHENELRAIHAQACAAVLKSDRTLSPVDEAFWPRYIQAILEARSALPVCNGDDAEHPLTQTADVRAVALEEAAAAVSDHQRAGREWIRGSLWDTLTHECVARIRALQEQKP